MWYHDGTITVVKMETEMKEAILAGLLLLVLLTGLVEMSLDQWFAFDACLQDGGSTESCEAP